jgi:hypothetical protein
MKDIDYFVGEVYGHFLGRFLLIPTKCLCWLLLESSGAESEMINTQMGRHSRSEMVTVHGLPGAIPPSNSNQ